MTDITNIQRMGVRSTARIILDKPYDHSAQACELASFILATVDAPAPTIAEELRYRADLLDNGDPDGDTPHVLRALATRAERMGHDLAEARAEVERLTAVNENLRKTDNYREFREQFLTVQKGAESNAETPDPADVKPGEAWKALIWYDDVRYPGTAIKSSGGDWVVIRDGGSHSTFRMNEYVELVSRLVPAPRVITNPDELEHLAATSIIRDGRGWPGGITEQGVTMINGFCISDEDVLGHGPVTVLWGPEA